MTSGKVFVAISDMQVPYHSIGAVAALQQFVADFQPDELLCVGDEQDGTQISQWTKGLAGEYAGNLQDDFDLTAEVMLDFKKAVGDKPFNTMRSNHGDRIKKYLAKYGPALAHLRDLQYENMLRYKENGITYHDGPYEFAPGWVMAHGDEGGAAQTAGGTALTLAKKFGASCLTGHTHKLGLQHNHDSINGRITRRVFGMEIGHLMEFGDGDNSASYLRAGSANWQQGFGVIYQHGDIVTPLLVPIIDKSFVVEGQRYSW